jgi:hypothetical protein
MNKNKLTFRIGRILMLILLMMSMIDPGRVLADDGPKREQIIEITFTEYTWWLVEWQDASLVCEVKVDHPDQPTGAEIYDQCGRSVYYRWFQTQPCDAYTGDNPQDCSGLYHFQLGSEVVTKEISLELPPPTVSIELKDCILIPDTDLCSSIPAVMISAVESLPNEEISRVQGSLGGSTFLCPGDICELPLQATDERGVIIQFWAESSYGDSSEHYLGRIRVTNQTDDVINASGWRVEIASGLEDLSNMEGCAGIWQSFPPLGELPDWLRDPSHAFMLRTSEPYTFLAGQMIRKGYVDTSHCPDYGITADGYASQCGLEASRELVNLWQNMFDRFILQSSKETGIPSSLLKRIFAKESQFWPESTENIYREYGFGHLTELGADTTLLWNREFYDQFCPLVLEVGKCYLGYGQLDDYSQALLRGALLIEMEISLPADLDATDFKQLEESVSLFSETLLGNCAQVSQMITYRMDEVPGEIASYEDLWRFTLANYHGGSGCLANAINQVNKEKQDLTWGNVAIALGENCPWVLEYVYDVTD